MSERHVVVGVDGSAPSRAALRWAVGLAATFDAEVFAVHAVGLREAGRADIATTLEQWCAEVASRQAPRLELWDGPAPDVLVRAAHEHDAALLVVGSRGTGGDPGRALGSTSLAVLETADIPVLVVPSDSQRAGDDGRFLGNILVAVDRSQPSLMALELAADVAAATGGTLAVVEVLHFVPPFPLGPATTVRCAGEEDATGRTMALLEDQIRGIRLRGVRIQVVVRSGDPVETLLELAEHIDVDLVVMGTRGRGDPAAPLVGSVARNVVDRVRRPTLVVPAAAGAVRLPVGRDS